MHGPMIAQCAAPALALAVGGALRPPPYPPLIPPSPNRCDEAAEVKNMLYSSYAQFSPSYGHIEKRSFPTCPHCGAKLHTAAICDLDDSPPNSLF